jgi:hypothetical protein
MLGWTMNLAHAFLRRYMNLYEGMTSAIGQCGWCEIKWFSNERAI